jgi:hypothetical protein
MLWFIFGTNCFPSFNPFNILISLSNLTHSTSLFHYPICLRCDENVKCFFQEQESRKINVYKFLDNLAASITTRSSLSREQAFDFVLRVAVEGEVSGATAKDRLTAPVRASYLTRLESEEFLCPDTAEPVIPYAESGFYQVSLQFDAASCFNLKIL